MLNVVSGSGYEALPTSFWSKNVEISEKVLALNYLRSKQKVNLGQLQGKHNVQIFSSKILTNDIIFFNSYANGDSACFKCNNSSIYKFVTTFRSSAGCSLAGELGPWMGKICVSEKFLRHKLIQSLLARQGVHPNPGPMGDRGVSVQSNVVKSDLVFMTYNCRGLNNVEKLRRLFGKLNQLVNQNYIVALQETHRINDRIFNLYWKEGFIKNCNSTNKGGVVLLYRADYKVNQIFMDEADRVIVAEIENDKYKLIVGNVYYPNDHREAITFNENIYHKILEAQFRTPEAITCLMGDINHCLTKDDSINRATTNVERDLARLTIDNNEVCSLVDSYRALKKKGGFTWSRDKCQSRLDYIFISQEFQNKITEVGIDWCLEKSDHAAVFCKFKIGENITKGPGISRLNVNLLDNVQLANDIKGQIKEMIDQIPTDWNPHTKLEYVKVAIRSVFANVGGVHNRERNLEIRDIEEQINRLNGTKERELLKDKVNEVLVDKIDEANRELGAELEILRKKYSEDLAFKSGVKWYEEGEKSNRYFLGLMKAKARRKLIEEISDGEGFVYRGQANVTKCITEFYKKLYSKVVNHVRNYTDVDFFKLCPKLDEESRKDLDRDITIGELFNTLKNCKESAPGPDGITYKIYRHLWPMVGNFIFDSWQHSIASGLMPPSHLESTLTLLPKDGKDSREIKNWRPITLSNCDAKIITKTLADRMSKHLNKIIDPSQTAYIPGRSVMDNMRSNFYLKQY